MKAKETHLEQTNNENELTQKKQWSTVSQIKVHHFQTKHLQECESVTTQSPKIHNRKVQRQMKETWIAHGTLKTEVIETTSRFCYNQAVATNTGTAAQTNAYSNYQLSSDRTFFLPYVATQHKSHEHQFFQPYELAQKWPSNKMHFNFWGCFQIPNCASCVGKNEIFHSTFELGNQRCNCLKKWCVSGNEKQRGDGRGTETHTDGAPRVATRPVCDARIWCTGRSLSPQLAKCSCTCNQPDWLAHAFCVLKDTSSLQHDERNLKAVIIHSDFCPIGKCDHEEETPTADSRTISRFSVQFAACWTHNERDQKRWVPPWVFPQWAMLLHYS